MHIAVGGTNFYKIIEVLLTLIIAICLNIVLRSLIKLPHTLETRRAKSYVMVVRNAITLIIAIVTLHVIFITLGLDITPLLASAGVIGIVVGIGARSLFEDLIAGFFLISQSSIAVGDHIKIGNNIEGIVTSIGFRNLILKGFNGALIIVPNGQINDIMNFTSGKANNTVDIPIKTGQPINHVLKVCTSVLREMKKDENFKLGRESKVVGVKSIDGKGSITITILLISPSSLRGSVDMDYRYRLIREFEKEKLEFA